MKNIPLLFLCALAIPILSACSSTPENTVVRHHIHDFEQEYGYASAVTVGNLLYISGVVSYGDSMEEQVTGVFKTLRDILERHQLTPDDVIKENAYTTDMEKLKAERDIRLQFYGNKVYPAATWVQVDRLFMEEFMLEVELIAVLPKQ